MTGALLNGLGALVRLISALPAVNHNHMLYYQAGYAVAMSGQILCAAAQPFTLYAPTKFAMLWFGDKERAIPTALASMGEYKHVRDSCVGCVGGSVCGVCLGVCVCRVFVGCGVCVGVCRVFVVCGVCVGCLWCVCVCV